MNPLFKPIKNVALVAFLAASIMITLTGCDQDRLAGCEGDIIVENEIPDLVMHLGDEPFRRDVFEDPVVFRHTAGNTITIIAIPTDGLIISAARRINPNTGRASIVEVVPRSIGDSNVEIIASDDCFDRRRTTTFKVTVFDVENEE